VVAGNCAGFPSTFKIFAAPDFVTFRFLCKRGPSSPPHRRGPDDQLISTRIPAANPGVRGIAYCIKTLRHRTPCLDLVFPTRSSSLRSRKNFKHRSFPHFGEEYPHTLRRATVAFFCGHQAHCNQGTTQARSAISWFQGVVSRLISSIYNPQHEDSQLRASLLPTNRPSKIRHAVLPLCTHTSQKSSIVLSLS
jgi:hypothetical protein